MAAPLKLSPSFFFCKLYSIQVECRISTKNLSAQIWYTYVHRLSERTKSGMQGRRECLRGPPAKFQKRPLPWPIAGTGGIKNFTFGTLMQPTQTIFCTWAIMHRHLTQPTYLYYQVVQSMCLSVCLSVPKYPQTYRTYRFKTKTIAIFYLKLEKYH